MYHCKIARTDQEFEAIARLNYKTFVEEIPQHPPNEARLLVDQFHEDNTYIVLYKDEELIGMLAFRDQRPFSIDTKVGGVENYLAFALCEKMCEVRLLAIKKEHRVGRVFLRLAQALYTYVLGKNYTACVISGITTQEHLYKQIGFTQFAEAVGTEEARYLPMVLTSEDGQAFYMQFQKKHHLFFPGPVEQTSALSHTTVSHRSGLFEQMQKQLKASLLQLADAKHVAIMVGSGTLANEVMLKQLKARFGNTKGFICTNGEFGHRLVAQAAAIGLHFDIYEEAWGAAYNAQRLDEYMEASAWCAFVHGETSTGTLNDAALFQQLATKHDVFVAADCISSFGAVPFSVKGIQLASATSGKAIGALAGLSFVFYEEQPLHSGAYYTDLANYDGQTPYTLPAYLVANVCEALQAYPQRYDELAQHLRTLLQLELPFFETAHYPTAVTFDVAPHFVIDAQLNGFELHAHSAYLKSRNVAQISTIQPTFITDLDAFTRWLAMYQKR